MYIHELEEWPDFKWDHEKIGRHLAAVSRHQGRLVGRMEALGFKLRAEAVLESLTEEVIKSSEIEGEILDKDQVRSSIARRLGIDIGAPPSVDRKVEGVVEMMLDATQNYEAPLTEDRLFGWHADLFPASRSGLRPIAVGAWRKGPMEIVSGQPGRERVHFEAPDPPRLKTEMRGFLKWFNGRQSIDPVLKAAIAHLWFVTIHPFDDGNGRIARAIADMALARSENIPRRFYSMSAQIRVERKAYYEILELTQRSDSDITAWLLWFLNCLDHAFIGAEKVLANVLKKAKFWETHAQDNLSERQTLVVNRLLEGFEGKLTSSKWAILTKTSPDTALRDIDDLTRRGILVKDEGGGRSTSYSLVSPASAALKAVASYARRHADTSARPGARPLDPKAVSLREAAITRLADEFDALSESAQEDVPPFHQFAALLDQLHQQGTYPDEQLIAAVAEALQ